MVDTIESVCRSVVPPDPVSARLSRVRQLAAARPPGSLGVLDEVVHRVAAIRRDGTPAGDLPAVVSVLAGDHGVAKRGISAFRAGLTGTILALIQSGRAPVNILARRVPAAVQAADFGLHEAVGDQRYKVAPGTSDICQTDAMPVADARAAVCNGISFARDRFGAAQLVAVGEIGIGNTTATAALAARLLGLAPSETVGAGSGVDDATVARKRELVAAALARTAGVDDPLLLLATLGGYEIAGNVGVILASAAARRVVVLDGYITGVAALVATRLCPAAAGYLVAAHCSAEPGHAAVLERLGLQPLLSLQMRLGMASGAALALGVIGSALAVTVHTPPARLVELAEAR